MFVFVFRQVKKRARKKRVPLFARGCGSIPIKVPRKVPDIVDPEEIFVIDRIKQINIHLVLTTD